MVFLALLLNWSQALQHYSAGPHQSEFETKMRFLIGDLNVGDEVQIELTFPEGSKDLTAPAFYTPRIYDAVT